MEIYSSILAWKNPMDRGIWWESWGLKELAVTEQLASIHKIYVFILLPIFGKINVTGTCRAYVLLISVQSLSCVQLFATP